MNKLSIIQRSEVCKLYLSGINGIEISKQFNVSPVTIYKVLRKNNIQVKNSSTAKILYEIDNHLFEVIDSEWKAYFLGLLYADGNVFNNDIKISLHHKDKDILEILNNLIFNGKRKLQFRPGRNGGSDQFCLQITNKKMASDIIKLGCIPAKSLILQFPSFSQISLNLFNHFIRGYFDGDGYIAKSKKTNFNITSSKDFCIGFQEFIKKEINVELKVIKYKNIYRCITSDKQKIKQIYEYLYQNSTLFFKRKKDIFEKIINETNWHKLNKPRYSKYRGVSFDKRRNLWIANKKYKQKNHFIGYFKTELEANNAFIKYENALDG